MKKRKISTTIYLTEEQNSLLKELSQRSKVPIAVYIRQGVNLILKKHSIELPGQLSFTLEEEVLKGKQQSNKKSRSGN